MGTLKVQKMQNMMHFPFIQQIKVSLDTGSMCLKHTQPC